MLLLKKLNIYKKKLKDLEFFSHHCMAVEVGREQAQLFTFLNEHHTPFDKRRP